MRRTLRLAEPALDAFVDERVRRRQRLQVLQVRPAVLVDDHAGVQQPLERARGDMSFAAHDSPLRLVEERRREVEEGARRMKEGR